MKRLVLLALCACGNSGIPAFQSKAPAPLATAGAPQPADQVVVHMKALPWWTAAGTGHMFVLNLQAPDQPPPPGRRFGVVRSRDIVLDEDMFGAVRCAWQIVEMGTARPCSGPRIDAMEKAHTPITEARADLAAQAGAAGARAVVETQCFADTYRSRSRLWCEGVATAAGPVGGPPAPHDPAAPTDRAPGSAPTRLLITGDGSIGMLGDRVVVGSTLSLRYRPFELGFYMLDLQRTTLAPKGGGLVGLGGTALGRIRLGRSRADAIVGMSALAVLENGATNPGVDGLYHGFAGLAYQSSWRIAGSAQPFVQLRVGAAAGSAIDAVTPMVELHLGLTSPERR